MLKRRSSVAIRASVLVVSVAIGASVLTIGAGDLLCAEKSADSEPYDPPIVPGNFVPAVTNKYFALRPGTKFVFRNKSGSERIEILVTDQTKEIMGVPATVVHVKEWKKGALIEETHDWYAQDKTGTVWYFGEEVDNYRDGKLVDHKGSWEAGVDGAKPGIIMLGQPRVGETYRQEYYRRKAEDMGTIMAVDATVSVPLGAYDNCLQIRDWSHIEPGKEHKYYCPAVGFLTMEESVGGGDKLELVEVQADR